ncbi:discoidin domain-containing protein [Sabulilitoribacter multivorans]|uniref:Discoidin domain-containing protein n=1 Tax=Flaviramulus multivorans TaxID=1304750 RepID=A0ABS9ILX8_9FLAO|nr:discoidin domain-containing protein [Flaviramulus multivorans]MCF7561614.1 discoidin domain-containing protein [Flaviramulus multivorans]
MKKFTLLSIALMFLTFGYSQNLALTGVATGSNENQPASNAIDGNVGTRWETSFSDPQWITIDLGASYDIGQVVLNWEGAFASTYEIQITDDATFTTYATAYTTTTGNGGMDVIPVSETGRYVRMYGTVRGTPYGYSLWEFEIYEAVDPLTDTTLSDLTVNGSTVAGFSSNTLNYNVELPQGTTVVPTVIATTSQASPASAVVTDASSLPGTTSILVTAQNGTDTMTYNINFTVQITPMSQTFDLTFESGTTGSVASSWNVFENDSNPPFEVVANPNASGVNTSATVAKMTTLTTGAPWAGCETQHGTIWEWKLDGTTTTITIDVYKPVISDVTVKMVNTTSGTVFQIAQPNTMINTWETLTYDISSFVASGDNNNVDQIVVFPDWQDPRTTENISYFDNISWEGLITGAAPSLGTTNFTPIAFKAYPNPTKDSWTLKSKDLNITSINVFDVLGKNVLSLKPDATEVKMDASYLKSGIYFAKIDTANGSSTLKLVKQ